MKVLIFIHSMAGGGAERVTANLANHWAKQNHKVSIVTLASCARDSYALNPAIRRITLELAGNSNNLFIGLIQNLRRVLAFRRVLRMIKPDIAMGMMTASNVLLALASWGLPKTRTVGAERTYPPQYPLGLVWEWLRRCSYGHLDVVVAQTQEGVDWLTTNTRAEWVEVIPNPVDWPMESQQPHLDKITVDLSGRYLLLAVGRLSSEKQFGLLTTCFQSLANRYPEWDLVILGEGPLQVILREKVLAAGLEKRVFFPGRAGNVGEWYEKSDLYVMSSSFEGFPNTLVEAMAYGLPAVSFDCDTGPRDIINHGVNGLLVPSGDVIGLTEALGKLMGDAGLRERFAARAIIVRELFATELVSNKWIELFEEVCK